MPPRNLELEPEARDAIDQHLEYKILRWAKIFGIANVLAILAGYVYVVGFAADTAAKKAADIATDSAIRSQEQSQALQTELLSRVAQNLENSGAFKDDLEEHWETLRGFASIPEETLKDLTRILADNRNGVKDLSDLTALKARIEASEQTQVDAENRLVALERNAQETEEALETEAVAINVGPVRQNSSSRPLLVVGYCNGTNDHKDIEAKIGERPEEIRLVATESGTNRGSVTFVVPPEWYYGVARSSVEGVECIFEGWRI